MEQENVGKSVATRELIQAGLDAELDEQDDSTDAELDTVLLFTGIVFVGLALAGEPAIEFYALTGLILAAAIALKVMDR